MKPDQMTLEEAQAERARILGWRSLDAKAWWKVQQLDKRIHALREQERLDVVGMAIVADVIAMLNEQPA